MPPSTNSHPTFPPFKSTLKVHASRTYSPFPPFPISFFKGAARFVQPPDRRVRDSGGGPNAAGPEQARPNARGLRRSGPVRLRLLVWPPRPPLGLHHRHRAAGRLRLAAAPPRYTPVVVGRSRQGRSGLCGQGRLQGSFKSGVGSAAGVPSLWELAGSALRRGGRRSLLPAGHRRQVERGRQRKGRQRSGPGEADQGGPRLRVLLPPTAAHAGRRPDAAPPPAPGPPRRPETRPGGPPHTPKVRACGGGGALFGAADSSGGGGLTGGCGAALKRGRGAHGGGGGAGAGEGPRGAPQATRHGPLENLPQRNGR
mmetsp:Transcript_327/g.743  ORF Transcript_327/g.743 Transcript_327/m.743 type:complete len:312 (-) Transcript_327:253-1188(-)